MTRREQQVLVMVTIKSGVVSEADGCGAGATRED